MGNGEFVLRCGGDLRFRVGLASWQDGTDRPGAHGVNSLSGLRGYGGGVNESRRAGKQRATVICCKFRGIGVYMMDTV